MPDSTMPNRPYLTTRAHRAFGLAHRLARATDNAQVTARMLAASAIRQRGLLAAALQQRGLDLQQLEAELMPDLPEQAADSDTSATLEWTAWDEAVLAHAREEADAMGMEHFSTEHLLLALIRDQDSEAARVLARHGVSYALLREDLRQVYQHSKPGSA